MCGGERCLWGGWMTGGIEGRDRGGKGGNPVPSQGCQAIPPPSSPVMELGVSPRWILNMRVRAGSSGRGM